MAPEAGMRVDRLLGRRSECEALDRLVSDVVAGTSRVLVLRGDGGAGKSALLGYLTERVQGWQTLSAAGVESEMELAYSGLQQLCAPLLGRLCGLPGPQRDALATAFGMSAGPPPDRFLVGLATLSLVAGAADDGPLACLVDDAQWLDLASAQTLAFVGRRLLADRVALVCTARTGLGDDVLEGLPVMAVGGLGDADARTLLLDSVLGPLDAAIRDQIIAESHGNPLALLELPRTWRAADLAGGFGLPGSRPLAGRIEQSYVRRLRLLPPETRLLVLAAAAEPLGDPVLLQRAAGRLGVDMAAAAAAVDGGLLHMGGRVEFAHPLVRSATYRAAPDEARRSVHRALAEVTDAAADPDRRAWHRAGAAAEPDEEVAAELERSAGRAQSRGGLAAAAAFLTRAAELTPAAPRRVQRALAAASATVRVGAFDRARDLLGSARDGPVDEFQRAQIDLLGAQLAFASRRGNEAAPLLLAAARRLQPLDAALARETFLDAFSAALFGARLNDRVGVSDVALAARSSSRAPDGEPAAADLLLDGLVTLADDYAAAVPVCRAALQKLSGDHIPAHEKLRRLWQGCVVALELWDDRSAYALSEHDVRTARETGTLSELALALSAHIPVLVFRGEIATAATAVAEGRWVEDVSGIGSAPYGGLILSAWRGAAVETRDLIDATTAEATARGEGIGLAICDYAQAVLCNGAGEYDAALGAARSASGHAEVVAENWGLSELVEPAVRTGHTALAQEALERIATKARATGTDWALGLEARSRALLADGERADDRFRAAIEHLGRTRVRAELARTHLLFGEWLRGAGRRADAADQLDVAFRMFTAMGMAGFAERTRRELAAVGATVRRRSVAASEELTAQEARIARLARDGLSNPEIGAQLYISARTVEWHLRKVFAKVGVSSRRQLRKALSDQGQPVAN